MIDHRRELGFTAVEVLITLFIAAVFIIAGYALYGVVIKDNGSTRAQTVASDLAYNYMRQYSASATKPCTVPSGFPLTLTPTVTGLSNVSVTVSIDCPYSGYPTTNGTSGYVPLATQQSVSEILVTVNYNNPVQSLSNAVYVTQ
jgi:hypothetical protein